MTQNGFGTPPIFSNLHKKIVTVLRSETYQAIMIHLSIIIRFLQAVTRRVSYAVIETNGTLSAALRPEQEAATLADLQLKVQQTQATIPFVLDGQVLEDNLRWCGKDRAWLERTATANTVLPQEILLLIGNETEDYFLLKKEGRQPGGKR